MKWTLRQAVWATVAYAAIFDYPLTKKEILRWLISYDGEKRLPLSELVTTQGYYATSPRLLRFVSDRKRKEEIAKKKWIIAVTTAKILRHIPTIQLIGVSGGLAMNNADSEDDIDIFIIVSPKTIWITRLLVLLALTMMGRRRRYGVTQEQDLICPNMFLSQDAVRLPVEQRDIYSAHEIVQMVPLFERGNIYAQFLQANAWVEFYLPNAWKNRRLQASSLKLQEKQNSIFWQLIQYYCRMILWVMDPLAKFIELSIMKRHRTTEIATDSALQFHPRDARIFVEKRFLKALQSKNIPLDSMFFSGLQ